MSISKDFSGDNGASGDADFIHEVGHLKHVARTGWTLAGIPSPESVAEHSFRTAIIAYILAVADGSVDAARTAVIALFHDVPESRIGDIASVGKPYFSQEVDDGVIEDQVASLHPRIRDEISATVNEYREQASFESQIARDADNLECLAQALEYSHRGFREAELWVKGSYDSVTTPAGRKLADELMEGIPNGWWAGAVANYRSRPGNDLSQSK